jgi:hypothetical protein
MRWDFGSSRGTANSFRRSKVSEKQLTLFGGAIALDSLVGIRPELHIERLIFESEQY